MRLYASILERESTLHVQANNSRKIDFLIERAHLLALVRSFFAERNYLELDTPLLSQRSCLDVNIDPILVESTKPVTYLVTSPEYAMKRLLALGFPNAYQLSHVFRAGELSGRHNPEFCMIEWYHLDAPNLNHEDNFNRLIEETLELIQMAIGEKTIIYHEYWDLFKRYLDLDLKPYVKQSDEIARDIVRNWCYEQSQDIPLKDDDYLDNWLSYLISVHLEPRFEEETLHVVQHFPATQAALATTLTCDGLSLARRFEIYLGTLELANGYHELTCADEQQKRLLEAQEERISLQKTPLVIDERFVESLRTLPNCCGVAVGFDRLLMKRTKASCLGDVLPFTWEEA